MSSRPSCVPKRILGRGRVLSAKACDLERSALAGRNYTLPNHQATAGHCFQLTRLGPGHISQNCQLGLPVPVPRPDFSSKMYVPPRIKEAGAGALQQTAATPPWPVQHVRSSQRCSQAPHVWVATGSTGLQPSQKGDSSPRGLRGHAWNP